MNRISTLTLLAIICLQTAQAQSWQWANRMGGAVSAHHTGQLAASIVEDLLDMATDPNGNVYILYTDRDSLMDADGHALAGHGKNDILLCSFSCTGAYRWSKVIGTSLDSDRAVAVRADDLGGVYVCGVLPRLAQDTGHIDRDTTILSHGRHMFLAKWDTAGRFQWLRMPEPDTMSRALADRNGLTDMDVDAQGNSYLLTYLTPGAYGGGAYVVSVPGVHVLMFGIGGSFVRGLALPIHGFFGYTHLTHLTFNGSRDRFIVKGSNSAIDSIGNTPLPQFAYIATFNAYTGAVGFVIAGSPNNVGVHIPGRVKIDAQDNIYIAGQSNHNSSFNGVTFTNTPFFPPARHTLFVMKMDALTGKPVWTVSAQTSINGYAKASAIALSGNKVMVGGLYRDSVIFPTAVFSNNFNLKGDDCFAMQLDAATGAIQSIDTFGGPGTLSTSALTDVVYGLEADRRGNFYLCGTFDKSLRVGSTSLLSAGGQDAFVAKLGYANCNCIIPKASFTSSPATGNTARYTYTGTVSGIDSLVWEWGDGTRQKLTSGFATLIPHTFPSAGHYNVCVTAYTANCGTHTYCKQVPLSAPSVTGLANVRIYPNPASDRIHIEGLPAGRVEVLSLLGQRMLDVAIMNSTQSLDISSLPPGIYLLVLSDDEGRRGVVKVTKY